MKDKTVNVFTYPRTEPGTLGHLELIEPLRAMPRALADAIEGIHEEDALYRESPDSWCIKEIVGHLRDFAEIEHKRIYMISTQTDPILEPYDQEALAVERAYAKLELQQTLRELRDHRAATVDLLTSLVNWNWARTGQHLESGRKSIRQIVEHMVEHEAKHLADIRKLRALAGG